MLGRALDGLDAWGRGFRGERRLFPLAVGIGAMFFLIVRVTMAFATGLAASASVPSAPELAAGSLAFGAFWGGAALLATMGLPRVFLVGVLGHLLGYVVASVNVANAARSGYETTLPLLTLVQFTLIGLLGGMAAEGALAARKRLRARRPAPRVESVKPLP